MLATLSLSAMINFPIDVLANEVITVSEQSIEKSLSELTGKTIDSNLFDQYEVMGKTIDHMGKTHYTLKQFVDGIPVNNGEVKIHTDTEGKIVSFTGRINEKNIALKGTPVVTEERAAEIAQNMFGKSARVFQQKQFIDTDGTPFWLVKVVSSNKEKESYQYKINALDESILEEKSALQQEKSPVTSSGKKTNGSIIQFTTLVDSDGVHYLSDEPENESTNSVYDYRTLKDNNMDYVTSKSNFFDDAAAVDAFDHGRSVYNYYRDNFDFRGVDGKKAPIQSIVNDTNSAGNAYWEPGSQAMFYGAYKGKSLSAAKDIVGHETTHGVINNSSALEYHDQSGALNESIADTFGYFMDPKDWTIGEDIDYTLRDLSNPKRFGQPDHMNDYKQSANTYEGDWGGVHTNSGIMNKAAFNIISSIGRERAQKIYFNVMQYYLNSQSDFKQMRDAMVHATREMYPNDKEIITAVNNAYADVGVGERMNPEDLDNMDIQNNIQVTYDGSVSILDFQTFSGMK